ncbi:hypothetical protein BKG93_06085 [Rodentibacter ratti]|uniref:Uncharacterized protein n=2 Tax=Rodentibacter TaxID=1960084 RepID=A0A1V3L4F3_9PAST|nr:MULTISPECIES: hypothetical protein [Rodentibacter]OOF79653.1 hypothetical protein BKG96_01240 [Rodentibacter heylii]OOF84819.1 hypothetical protein BKG93_06085 [Rodentibacter ratti]
MEIKLNKKMWGAWLETSGNQARLALDLITGFRPAVFSLKKETRSDFVLTNCSTADAELIAGISPNGLQIKSRYSKKFVDFDDPIWRG